MILDAWSSAVVGFHCCLHGPSWETAKTALFSVLWDPLLIASYWGFDTPALLPIRPVLPYELETDRGEYLSQGGLATAEHLGFKMLTAASYRPDWKGGVEVIFRILKDVMIKFVPGAIDARRKEIELRADARTSVLTLAEFVHLIWILLREYNHKPTHEDRLTSEMIALGVHPSAAGLYNYGRLAGLAAGQAKSDDELIRHLLPTYSATLSGRGLHLGGLPYESELSKSEDWASNYRQLGAKPIDVSVFSSTNRQLWWLDPRTSTHVDFSLGLATRAAPGMSMEEWVDAETYRGLSKREHEALQLRLGTQATADAIVAAAKARTAEADAAYSGPRPTTREARDDERQRPASEQATAAVATPPTSTPASEPYRTAMNEALAALEEHQTQ